MPTKRHHHKKNPHYHLLLASLTVIALIGLFSFIGRGPTGQAVGVVQFCNLPSDCGPGYNCVDGMCSAEAIQGPLPERIEPPLPFKKAPTRPLFQPLKDMPLTPVPVKEAPKRDGPLAPFQDKTPPAIRTISIRERDFSCETIGEVACVRGDPNNQYDPDSYKAMCTKSDLAPDPYWGNIYVDKATGAVSEGWNTIVSPFRYADEKCMFSTPAGKKCGGTESKCLATYSSRSYGPVYKKFICGGGVFVRGQEDYLDSSCTKSHTTQCPDSVCSTGETCEMDRCCNGSHYDALRILL